MIGSEEFGSPCSDIEGLGGSSSSVSALDSFCPSSFFPSTSVTGTKLFMVVPRFSIRERSMILAGSDSCRLESPSTVRKTGDVGFGGTMSMKSEAPFSCSISASESLSWGQVIDSGRCS